MATLDGMGRVVTIQSEANNHDSSEHHRLLPAPGHHGRRLKDEAPWMLKKRSSKWYILITVCVSLFTDSFIYGVLVPVLPFMMKDRLHVREGREQIWTSVFFAGDGAAILVGSLICGYLADRTRSRQIPLLLSMPVLALSTVLLGVGQDVWTILVSRILHGLSTAITWTVGLALVVDTVGKEEVGQWMGTALSSSSVGLIISPLLGGILYAQTGLWGVLGIIIALSALMLFLIAAMIEKHTAEKYYIVSHHQNNTNGNPYNTFPNNHSGNGAPRLSNSTITDSDADHITSKAKDAYKIPPLLRLLRSPRILAGAYGVFTQFGLLASFDAFLPLFVKRRFGWSSLGAGLIFLNLAIPAIAGPLAGRISDRYGPRKVALAGCLLGVPPLLGLRLVGFEGSKGQVGLLCGLLVLIGLFLTLIISPLAADLSFAVDKLESKHPGAFGERGAYAQAYSLFNAAMAASTVVGPVVAGTVQDRFGAPTVAWVLAVWCASAAVPVVLFIGDKNETGNGKGKALDVGGGEV